MNCHFCKEEISAASEFRHEDEIYHLCSDCAQDVLDIFKNGLDEGFKIKKSKPQYAIEKYGGQYCLCETSVLGKRALNIKIVSAEVRSNYNDDYKNNWMYPNYYERGINRNITTFTAEI